VTETRWAAVFDWLSVEPVQWRPLICGVEAVSTAKVPTPAYRACLNSFWPASLNCFPKQAMAEREGELRGVHSMQCTDASIIFQ
jgi:hypothetical protein